MGDRASQQPRSTARLCRGDADEDVQATEMSGESHEQANGTIWETPELPGPQGHCRDGETLMSTNRDSWLLLAGTGRAPVLAALPSGAVAPPEAPGLRLELFYSEFTADEA